MKLEFPVTICLGGGDGGDVLISVDVSEEEYELLIDACADGDEIADCDELEDLYNRIISFADDECDWDYDNEDESDLEDAVYLIQYPDAIIDAAEEKEE